MVSNYSSHFQKRGTAHCREGKQDGTAEKRALNTWKLEEASSATTKGGKCQEKNIEVGWRGRYIQRPKHNIYMSGKISKWKEVNSTSERLNRMLSSKPSDLPTRFAPKRDRSESSDKLFNNSRSRIHSSFELTALNKTR